MTILATASRLACGYPKPTFNAAICRWASASNLDLYPDAFLANEDHASYLYDMNRYGEGGDEGRCWVETHITSPTRFLQFAQGQINIRTSHCGGSITRADYISPSALEQMLGLSRCAEWMLRLDSIELSEAESRTLALAKDAQARHARGEATKD
ncbi:hypothetical protein [Pseudomonas sp. 910_21]|uniref:hypothetical protein n=1 Tax=Pseudomonas sp. 910_21 TaxID=2604460 RepID=UPI0040638880